jgi:UMF1 family MFS transporter
MNHNADKEGLSPQVGEDMTGTDDHKRSEIFGWVLYDWANSAFATTVMAGFFPLYFKNYISMGMKATESTAYLGWANALGAVLIALSAPILGAISDASCTKKRFVAFFSGIGILSTILLAWIPQGGVLPASIIYALASLGFAGSISFYDSLLPGITTQDNVDTVSASGYAWGYLGGGLLFGLNVFMYQRPSLFGLSSGIEAVQYSFISVGFWWAIFSIPLFVFVREPRTYLQKPLPLFRSIGRAMRELSGIFSRVRNFKMTALFLLAFFLYNDGVGTTIKMAVDYGLSIGIGAGDLIGALLLVQFIGFPAAILMGKIARRFSPKTGIYICIGVYLIVIMLAAKMSSGREFYVLAGMIGLVQGGIQSLSRSFYARLTPKDRSGEFFGLYNLLGKFSGILGPVMVGQIGLLTGNSRIGIVSISLLFLLGGGILSRCRA